MKNLTHKEITVGTIVVFVDRKLNHGDAHVHSDRTQRAHGTKKLPHLDGCEGIVVHAESRTDHDAKCAMRTQTVKVKIKTWHGEGDERKEVESEVDEHAACDCGFAPGKLICVVLKDPPQIDGLRETHTCDGFAPDGNGVWARAEQLYLPEHHAAHKAAHVKAKARTAELDKRKAAAHAAAAKYTEKK